MKLVWTNEALVEIEAIVSYIAQDNASAAQTLADKIFNAVETVLLQTPKAGRPGRVNGTRECIVHSSYLIAYMITDNTLTVLTVRHAARLWPEEF